VNMSNILEDSNLSVENLTACYENWSQLNLQQNVSFSAGTTKYNFSGQAGRDILVNTYNWLITDGGVTSVPFIIEVDTTKAGISNSEQFEFTGAEGDYDVIAKQNGTQVATFNDLNGQETITLPSSGIYVLEVKSKEVNGFNRIQFSRGGDADKLLDIIQFGTTVWSNMDEAFSGCSNLVGTYTDIPDLSQVTTMRRMFRQANFNGSVAGWDVSNVTDFQEVFLFCDNFNQDLSSWDFSNGTNFRNFLRGTSFNFPLVNVITSNATEIDGMFQNTPFDQDISSWDVSNINNFSGFLNGGELSPTNYDLLLNSWSGQSVTSNNTLTMGASKFTSAGLSARNVLINTYNWTIEDGGQVTMLNQFSGASLGLSLDKLDKNYTGSAIKVRRSSDNAELDIGFVNNELDTASLLDFVGSGNGFVTIIYDQVGSNNMTKTTSSLQGQIVSNGEVILKGGKPCIIRSVDNKGGYLSTYVPNDGVAVKGMFYVGDNEGRKSIIFGSNTGVRDYGFVATSGSTNVEVDDNPTISLTKLNGSTTTIVNRDEAFTATNNQFLLYREIEFNFFENSLRLGYTENNQGGFGMFTFQELVIFENTDDAVSKENNINARYNNIY
jgi:hypothetical protein